MDTAITFSSASGKSSEKGSADKMILKGYMKMAVKKLDRLINFFYIQHNLLLILIAT